MEVITWFTKKCNLFPYKLLYDDILNYLITLQNSLFITGRRYFGFWLIFPTIKLTRMTINKSGSLYMKRVPTTPKPPVILRVIQELTGFTCFFRHNSSQKSLKIRLNLQLQVSSASHPLRHQCLWQHPITDNNQSCSHHHPWNSSSFQQQWLHHRSGNQESVSQ